MMVYNVDDVDVYDVLRSIYYKDDKDGAKRNFILLCEQRRMLQILHIVSMTFRKRMNMILDVIYMVSFIMLALLDTVILP